MIRPVRQSDLSALAELAKTSFEDAFGWSFSPDVLAAELEGNRSEAYFAQVLQSDTILVYEDTGGLAGYVQFGEPEWPDVETDPGDLSIHRLYVATHRQRQGIGRLLLQAALDHPRAAASHRVWLQVWEHNPGAIKLYKRFGFEMKGNTNYLAGNLGEEFMMVKTVKKPTHAN
jgi:ribosomal protein S18 acetylase RimI-like enzyme